MVLRIRLRQGRPIQRKTGKNRHVALALAALLVPSALMAYVLGFWRLASDMGLAGEFGFSGFFSHWQIWIPLGGLFQFAAAVLNKYGRGGEWNVPRILTLPSFPPRFKKQTIEERKVGSR
jgi:hypothetical protein